MANAPTKDKKIGADIVETNQTVEEVVPKNSPDMSEIIAKTVSKTMESIIPLLQKKDAQNETVKTESNNIRTRIIKEMNRDFEETVRSNRKFMENLANTPSSEKGIIRIPRVYAQYFGSKVPVAINGSFIYIPTNNRPYLIPKVYIPIVEAMLRYEDEKIAYMDENNNSDIREISNIK